MAKSLASLGIALVLVLAGAGCGSSSPGSTSQGCSAGQTSCSGACKDLGNDPLNCGTCGHACAFLNAAATCVAGTCTFAGCIDPDHWRDVDGDPANGCEYACPVSPPRAETCDGLDDDCNGVVDDVAGVGGACSGGGVNTTGECKAAWACNGTPGPGPNGLTCVQTVGPRPETCNGLDDDCNGAVDDSPVDVGTSCGDPCPGGLVANCVGACQAGTVSCVGGTRTCAGAVGPGPETCNTIDDDCDGVVDDNLTEAWAGQACCPTGTLSDCSSTGAGTRCHAGAYACSAGQQICAGAVAKSAEVCNGVDDDCNGLVDDVPGSGTACTGGVNTTGACRAAWACGGTPGPGPYGMTCTQVVGPTSERCNGIDDDCDGVVDNGFDLQTDPSNCGSCGNVCASGACGKTITATTAAQPPGWSFNGSARWDGAAQTLVLTVADVAAQAGTVTWTDPVTVDSLDVAFDARASGVSRGAGLAFMVQQDGATAVGATGGGLGVAGLAGWGVELDLSDDAACGDTNGNHVAVDSLASCGAGLPTPVAVSADLWGVGAIDLGDGGWHHVTVHLASGVVTVTVDGAAALSGVTLPGFVPGQPAWVGFGGSTDATGGSRLELRAVTITFPSARCL